MHSFKGRYMNDRTTRILEILTDKTRIEVSVLSRLLGVSQVTVRKDLDELEKKGILKREHGYAAIMSDDDINRRLAYHYDEKRKIAECCASLVKEGETIMIESGSCCTLLSDVLTSLYRDLTIITNSVFIASYIRGKSSFQIILTGGIYQQDSSVMVGPMVKNGVENFFVDKFFIGIDGYDPLYGFFNRDQLRAQAVRDMSSHCGRVIILTESSKFLQKGIVPLNLGSKVKMVITDKDIEPSIKNDLESKGIRVECI